jgi:hypothetical protein
MSKSEILIGGRPIYSMGLNNMKHIFLFLALTGTIAAPCEATIFIKDDRRIVPGQRIGLVKLGATYSDVKKILGDPDGGETRGPGMIEAWWGIWIFGQGGEYAPIKAIFVNNKVIQIEVSSERYSTPEGYYSRSKIADIERIYKPLFVSAISSPTATPGRADVYYYDAVRQGIAFTVHSPGIPSRQKTAGAFIVHRPGKTVIPLFESKPFVLTAEYVRSRKARVVKK